MKLKLIKALVLIAAAEAYRCNDGGKNTNPPNAGRSCGHDRKVDENSNMHSYTALQGISHHTEASDSDLKAPNNSGNRRSRRIHGANSNNHKDVLDASAMHSFTGVEGISHQTTTSSDSNNGEERSPVMKHTAKKVREVKPVDRVKPEKAASEMKEGN